MRGAPLALLALVALLAGCAPTPAGTELRGLEYRVDGGTIRRAESMREIRGEPESRTIDVWVDVTPPAHCDDPALLLESATALDAVELDGRNVEIRTRPYGVVPLPPGAPVRAHLVLRDRVDRSQGSLQVGCQRALVGQWLLIDLPQFLVAAVLLIAALLLGLSVGLRRGRPGYPALALFTASVGVVFVAQSPGFRNLLFVHPTPVAQLRDVCAFLYSAALARYLVALFGDTRRRFFHGLSIAAAAVATLGVGLELARVVGLRSTFVISQVLALVALPAAVVHVTPRARAGDRAARWFLSGIFVLLVFALPDLMWGLGLPYHFELNTAPFGILAFAGAMGAIVDLKFRERSAELERRNLELRERVDQLEKKDREIRGLGSELRHQIGQRSKELGKLLKSSDLASSAVVELGPGQKLGRYRIVGKLGEGAMGAVYEVDRESDGRRFALKVMSSVSSPSAAARFAREAEIAARISHPNVVDIADLDVLPTGVPFLVMELVTGGSLEGERERYGDVAWALDVLAQVAAGLEALHAAGVVHRDLKPANVLVSEAGVAKVADFGIARQHDLAEESTLAGGEAAAERLGSADTLRPAERLTRTGALIGTPLYMAPELGRGQVATPSSDVYALGLLAFELFTGRHPFGRAPALLALAGVPVPEAPPIEVPEVPEEVRGWIERALSVSPEQRPSARMLVMILSSAAHGAG